MILKVTFFSFIRVGGFKDIARYQDRSRSERNKRNLPYKTEKDLPILE